ncbi:hypothetical protein ACFL0Z_01800 [Patescibacteria group bacterium]
MKFIPSDLTCEKEIVKSMNSESAWMRKQGLDFTMPSKSIEQEYDQIKLQIVAKAVEAEWKKHGQDFFENLGLLLGKKISGDYQVCFTNYGPAGFYNLPNEVYLNINFIDEFDPVESVKHEIIHLLIEPFVIKKKLGHETKEDLVDTILKAVG